MLYHPRSLLATGLLAGAATACTIPSGPPLSNTILTGFGIQVQNKTQPQVHNKFMNLLEAGGGDKHLFIGPVGVERHDLTLINGVIAYQAQRAVINGEVRTRPPHPHPPPPG